MCTTDKYGVQDIDYSRGRCYNHYGVAYDHFGGRGVLSLVVVTTFGLLGQKVIPTTTMQTTSAELPYCLSSWSRSAINVTSFEATNSPASGNQLWTAVPNFNGVAYVCFNLVEEFSAW